LDYAGLPQKISQDSRPCGGKVYPEQTSQPATGFSVSKIATVSNAFGSRAGSRLHKKFESELRRSRSRLRWKVRQRCFGHA